MFSLLAQHQPLNDNTEHKPEPSEPAPEQAEPTSRAPADDKDLLRLEIKLQDDWNPFGNDLEEYECNEAEEFQVEEEDQCGGGGGEIKPCWRDENKTKVDAILLRRRRGDELKDASTVSTASTMDCSTDTASMDTSTTRMSASLSGSSSRRRRPERRGAGDATSLSGNLKRCDSGVEDRRLRREQRRSGRKKSQLEIDSGAVPSPPVATGGRPKRLGSSDSPPRRSTGGRIPLRRALTHDGSSYKKAPNYLSGLGGGEGEQRQPRRRSPVRNSDPGPSSRPGRSALRRTRTNEGLGKLVKSSCPSASATGCTNTSPNHSNAESINASPTLSKIEPTTATEDAAPFVPLNPTEGVWTRSIGQNNSRGGLEVASKNKKKNAMLDPKSEAAASAPTTRRPANRKASCVTLLRSSTSSSSTSPPAVQVPHCP